MFSIDHLSYLKDKNEKNRLILNPELLHRCSGVAAKRPYLAPRAKNIKIKASFFIQFSNLKRIHFLHVDHILLWGKVIAVLMPHLYIAILLLHH